MPTSSGFVIPSIFTAIDKFSIPVRTMGNAVAGFVGRSERLLGRANAAFTRLMTPISNLNRMLMGLGFYVGLFTLIRLFKNAIDIFADFQQANADLAVVMGTTVRENKALASEARRIGLAFGEGATGVVKMQHALATLGFERPDILKMGRPLITGAAALEGADPEKLANVVGAVINTFDNLDAGHTQHILDVMALSANRTALNFEKLATTLPIVSGPANAVGISFERVVALLGVLSNAGVHVATSATSLKNIFIDSAKKGHTYEQVIANIAKNSDKLTYANKLFGKRSVVSALVLTQKMNEAKNGVVALTEEFKNAKLGLTEAIAVDRLNTFRGAQKLLSAAYEEFILSIEDGNGSLAQSLTKILKVSTAMLLLSSDSDQAREAVTKLSPEILMSANKWLGWLKVTGYVIAALIAMKAILVVWRALVILATIAQGAWSIALGISAAAGWTNVWALRGNAIALGALKTITVLATVAQEAFNLALKVNPIYLIATAILGLVYSYQKLTNASNEFNKSQTQFASDNGLKFEEKQKSILDKLGLMFIPGYKADAGTMKFSDANYSADETGKSKDGNSWSRSFEKTNPKASSNLDMDSIMNIINKGKVTVDFNDPNGRVKDAKSDSSWIQPKVSTTNGW